MIEDLEEDEQRAVLRALEPDDRAAIEEALAYPEESAGRLMQRDLIAVPEHWTVGQVIDYLALERRAATDFWEVFVVDRPTTIRSAPACCPGSCARRGGSRSPT